MLQSNNYVDNVNTISILEDQISKWINTILNIFIPRLDPLDIPNVRHTTKAFLIDLYFHLYKYNSWLKKYIYQNKRLIDERQNTWYI